MTSLLAGAAILAGLILLTRWRAASAPDTPKVVRVDQGHRDDAAPAPVPRIIWSYWHAGQPPLVVERCFRNWSDHNPGYSVRCVSAQTLADYVEPQELPAGFGQMPPARQSDVLRLYFLRRYGGIWLDSSIILTRSLDWMIAAQQQSRAEYLGFYLQRYTTHADCPVIDSWCMAAPPASPFVSAWFEEFSRRALAGDVNDYIERVRSMPESERILQNIASPGYMAIHVAAQVVLAGGGAFRLALIRAEDSAYFYQQWSRWKRAGLFASLLLLRTPHRAPALIKLRGGERRKLEPYLRRNFYRADSLAGRHLSRP
jgi:hypothetical protein